MILDEAEIKPDEPEFIAEALRDIKIELRDGAVLVNDIDISGEIRTPHVDKIASDYSAVKCVRDALLHLQQEQQNFGSLIAEGRDVGSVVFPNADIKFYLTASPEARAKRRCLERELKGEAVNYDETLKAIKSRDEFDSKRENSPLKVPDNAIIIDTSEINEQETLNLLAKHVKEVLKI